MESQQHHGRRVAIIGAGPAGLFAAERLALVGVEVDIYDQMPSPARKLLMAGRGGLNLTHSEPIEDFLTRYQPGSAQIEQAIRALPPSSLVSWAEGLGQETFVGSSGRVFPKAMKSSPLLLRAWLRRLDSLGVRLHVRHRWVGFDDARSALVCGGDGVVRPLRADAVLLACGGASWPRLGSDGAFAALLAGIGVPVAPLSAANCGVGVAWSDVMRQRFAGAPVKRVALQVAGQSFTGEAMVTRDGLEGGPVYAAAPLLRKALDGGRDGGVRITLDLRPDLDLGQLTGRLSKPRGKQSTANWLRKSAAISPVAIALLREGAAGPTLPTEPRLLAERIKRLELSVIGLAGLERAISTAGGVAFAALDQNLMVATEPGLFIAGEMLDWEAPTGGYLLQATFATAGMAADGIARWLTAQTVRDAASNPTTPSPDAPPPDVPPSEAPPSEDWPLAVL